MVRCEGSGLLQWRSPAPRKGENLPRKWQLQPLPADSTPELRHFVTVLHGMALLLGDSMTAAARAGNTSPSVLSRYLSGARKPTAETLKGLHDKAQQAARSSGAACPTWAEFEEVVEKARAGSVRCDNPPCEELQQRYDAFVAKRRRHLMQTSQRKRLRMRSRAEAGSAASAAAFERPPSPKARKTVLPVPPVAGDRQHAAFQVPAALGLAKDVAALADGEREAGAGMSTLALLRQGAEVLTPLESAASAVLLHRQDPHLAASYLGMLGRDRPEKDVIRIAVALSDFGFTPGAEAILRTAAGDGAHA